MFLLPRIHPMPSLQPGTAMQNNDPDISRWLYLRLFDFMVLEAFDRSLQKIGDLYGISHRRISFSLPSKDEHGHGFFSFTLVGFTCSSSYSGIAPVVLHLFPKSQSSHRYARWTKLLFSIIACMHASINGFPSQKFGFSACVLYDTSHHWEVNGRCHLR
jgi:hypothetical protein